LNVGAPESALVLCVRDTSPVFSWLRRVEHGADEW